MTPPVVAVVGLVLAVALGVVVSYNRFVSGRAAVAAAWATTDAELQRRHDLIPGLVATVKEYAQYEQDVLVRATQARADAVAAGHTAADAVRVEPAVESAVRALVALREQYPQLNAAAQFLKLQQELATTEDRIAAARRYYNTKVESFNRRCGAFPSNLVARRGGFQPATFFET